MSTAVATIESTSRVGRQPVTVPTGVEVKIKDMVLTAKGPKGLLSIKLHPYVNVALEDGHVKVTLNKLSNKMISGSNIRLYKSIAGTMRANINNTIRGVSQGFEKKLTLIGVGYRAANKGKVIALSLGFSHPTEYEIPEGITIETPTQTEILIKGANKERVGQVAAEIRSIRPPENYKGKGVRYADEFVLIKETKKK